MAMTPGYQYDLFVSYAHNDDHPLLGGLGWVTHLVTDLEVALKARLGDANELSIFFDRRGIGPNRLPELVAAARDSALFLGVGSPSYAKHEWPRKEVAAFVDRVPDLSRVFLIECLPLNPGQTYPPEIVDHIPTYFWKRAGIPIPYSPAEDSSAFRLLTHTLAQRMVERLLSLRLLPAARAGTKPPASTPTTRRKTVLLAQVTDDLEDEAEQLRTYLMQFESEVVVLPEQPYPQGGNDFRAAFHADINRADLFVQLLGQRAGRVSLDLPEGYTYCQLEAARAKGLPIVQWRRTDADPAQVKDPRYRATLTADTVVASGLEAFKRQILETLRKPDPKPAPPPGHASMVFIDADANDLPFAKEIQKECLQRALTTIMPIAGKSSEETRQDLADNFTDCDALLFIYGDTTQDWIRSQLRFFSKVRQRREKRPKIAAIFAGPPPEKPDPGITIPDVQTIPCENGWTLEPVRTLLSELAS